MPTVAPACNCDKSRIAGARIFAEGSACANYLILLSGQIRVRKTGANGREIVLYRVEPVEICVVTTVCLMAGVDYDAEGVTETDIRGYRHSPA